MARRNAADRGPRTSSRDRAASAESARAARGAWLAPLLVLGAALWLRFPVLGYGFFADDYLFLDQARGRSPLAAWLAPDPLRNYWRPLSRQVYFSIVSWFGESPVAGHAMNLLLFLAILALLGAIARRLAGMRAAVVAMAIVALAEAADVPVLWVSGSQDLLAVAGALGCLWLCLRGRTGWATAALVGGLLSKETVLVTPAIAAWLLRTPAEPWTRSLRRVAPLLAGELVWLVIWALRMRAGTREGLRFGWSSIPAAIAHLPQAFLGAQWDRATPLPLLHVLPPLVPAVLIVAAILGARGDRAAPPESRAKAVTTGLLWAGLASLPVALVAHIWSSYYYLFAVCGLGLLAGALLERARGWVVALLVVLIAWGSENARRLESFATRPEPWGSQSHLSRFYFDRSLRWVSRYLGDLRAQVPAPPHAATFFFAGTPAFASWQAADGPLVRWAYRDSSLRSYYFGDFTLARARRGDVFVLTARNDSLVLAPDPVQGLQQIASGQLLSERFNVAHAAITRALDFAPANAGLHYWRAWVAWAAGDTSGTAADLRAGGCDVRAGSDPGLDEARQRIAAGDARGAVDALSVAIRRHPLDAGVHAALADLLLQVAPQASGGAIEALAARVLAPRDPTAWRRWSREQVANGHVTEAYASLARCIELERSSDPRVAADRLQLERLRAALPGGSVAQQALRERPGNRE